MLDLLESTKESPNLHTHMIKPIAASSSGGVCDLDRDPDIIKVWTDLQYNAFNAWLTRGRTINPLVIMY